MPSICAQGVRAQYPRPLTPPGIRAKLVLTCPSVVLCWPNVGAAAVMPPAPSPYLNVTPAGGFYTYIAGSTLPPAYTPTYAPSSTTYRYLSQPMPVQPLGISERQPRSFVSSATGSPERVRYIYR